MLGALSWTQIFNDRVLAAALLIIVIMPVVLAPLIVKVLFDEIKASAHPEHPSPAKKLQPVALDACPDRQGS